ncbi:MAG: hypothetical protein QF841_05475, partial [Arenicellales bacterium]|nr:hypothetical protein [Arenicellales bacterium]
QYSKTALSTDSWICLLRDWWVQGGILHLLLTGLNDDENGIDCIRHLRQETGKAIPGIIITADHSERVYSLVIEEGLFIINKPTPPARLRALLGHILTHSDKSIGKTEKLASVSQ